MTALAFARAREKGRERKIQKRRNDDDDDDDDSQMQRRERYLKQRKPWYFYICLWVCVREDFLCIRKEVPSFRGGKKASLGKQKALLASVCGSRNGRTERRDEACRRKKVFFRLGAELDKNAKNEKKQKEGNNQKKAPPKKDSESPHNKFLASTTMADVQHERGYQKQVGVNVG